MAMSTVPRCLAAALAAALAVVSTPSLGRSPGGGNASGQGVTVFQRSAYTTVDLSHCKKTKTATGDHHVCKGLSGYGVSVRDDGQRTYIGIGTEPLKTRAAEQTLSPLNTPFRAKTMRFPVEWRIVIREAKPVPYAAIIKYYTRREGSRSEVLVVIKMAGSMACHVALIDAVATVDAIVLARQIADERAAAFDCKSAPEVFGVRGAVPL